MDYSKWDKMAAMIADEDSEEEVYVVALACVPYAAAVRLPVPGRAAQRAPYQARVTRATRCVLTTRADQSAAPGRHPYGFATSKSGPVRVTVRVCVRPLVSSEGGLWACSVPAWGAHLRF